jgi:hypothetical protein
MTNVARCIGTGVYKNAFVYKATCRGLIGKEEYVCLFVLLRSSCSAMT